MIWKYVLTAVISYCLGNINLAITLSNLIYKKDIRDYGSGNAGTTNVYRVFGVPFGTAVMLFDIGKGALAVWLGGYVLVGGGDLLAIALAGFFAVVGHVYPAIFKFRGGKGVATVGGMLLVLDWRMFCAMLFVFLLILIFTRYMSIASMSTVITGPLSAFVIRRYIDGLPMGEVWKYVIVALFFGCVILFTHRSNIKRLLSGTENRLGKKKHAPESGENAQK